MCRHRTHSSSGSRWSHDSRYSRSYSGSRSRSPSVRRRRGSPSHLDRRRITRLYMLQLCCYKKIAMQSVFVLFYMFEKDYIRSFLVVFYCILSFQGFSWESYVSYYSVYQNILSHVYLLFLLCSLNKLQSNF